MSEGRFDLSTFRSERTNEASTLTITPKRSSSRDVVRWFLTENRKMKDQKINLKFCFKLDKALKEIDTMLVRVHEDQALFIKCWFAHFRKGRRIVFDKTSSGRPKKLRK
ncbi:hypothetical protein TNCV_1662791 [Trichonephila clavipes]|nr:hypothetical protein TNCV_1662791 [Trichonephila clavipes]